MENTENSQHHRYENVRFPEGLINWAGHRDGGVRRPFRDSTGRPTGSQIETPLVKRLKNWVTDLFEGKNVPKAIFLVGGPGNGKTDTVEGCITFLDEKINASGFLINAFREKYQAVNDKLPPRKIVVHLPNVKPDLPEHLRVSISLVQDATERDLSRVESPEEVLLEDLERVLNSGNDDIYLCCVNRGILASASELAHEKSTYSDVSNLLNMMTKSVTSSATSPSCWPLEQFPNIAVWPMDVESLVDKSTTEDGVTVAHQIFEVALDERLWKEPCQLKTRCPFCQNRKILTKGRALDSLIEFLHFYELSSGKRWTFRDLFSLVPYLLVGDHSELEFKGKILAPCDWAAEQIRISKEGNEGSPEKSRALFLLMSRLYHHRLFPVWPSFDKGDVRLARNVLMKGSELNNGINSARSFFNFMNYSRTLNKALSGDIPQRVRSSFGPTLDPALASQQEILFENQGKLITVAEVEERFSLSINDGVKSVLNQLETLEKDVLRQLVEADEALMEDKLPRNRAKDARILQSNLRQYSSRLVKRSIGTKNGICRNVSIYKRYASTIENASKLNEVRRALKSLLNDSHNRFCASLATTFGQPVAHKSKDISLILESPINVTRMTRETLTGRPKEYLPYLVVDKHFVPLTFELFQALVDVSDGLHESSLSSEIFSLLDRVKSLVSGRVVRDQSVLSEEPSIRLGISGDVIDYSDGEFMYRQEEL